MYILMLLLSFPLLVLPRCLLFVPNFAIVDAGIVLSSFSSSLLSIKSFFSLLPYCLWWRHCHGPFLFFRLYSSSSLSSFFRFIWFLCFPYSIFYLMHQLPSPFLSCLDLLLVFIFPFCSSSVFLFIVRLWLCFFVLIIYSLPFFILCPPPHLFPFSI